MPKGIYVRTEEQRKAASERIKRQMAEGGWFPFSEEHRRKIGDARRGKRHSPETRRKLSEAKRGERHPNWRGGPKGSGRAIREALRKSDRYKKWRLAVLDRDGHRCVMCSVSGVKLDVDHVKPFARFKAERFDVANGRTLCVPCHKATGTYGCTKELREMPSEPEDGGAMALYGEPSGPNLNGVGPVAASICGSESSSADDSQQNTSTSVVCVG